VKRGTSHKNENQINIFSSTIDIGLPFYWILSYKCLYQVNLGLNEKRQHRKHQPTTTANTENNINKLKVVG